MNDSIYEVTREEYKGFVEQIKPEYRDVKIERIGSTHTAVKIYSKKTEKCLCSRVAYTAEYGDPEPEKYYIFEMPDNDERCAPTPVARVALTSKEEVQALFNAIAQIQKQEREKNE